ncbi:MAG: succinylglutamate desuccinylase/aspartoacylase family protein [Xanthomonadales bacterium]|nr:succinylglutamate desuccinylase/aspartoacylase family protein [Xanthomonadales bacterium]
MARAAFEIGGIRLPPGQRRTIELPLSVMSNHVPVSLPVHVVHGRRQGPTLFLSAAIHGDEITGVEIIRRLLRSRALNRMAGTLLAVPIVNAFGFIGHSRYLPDRRDLNRVFPGSASGSLASQLAHLFMTEVVRRCQYGIDLHSAAIHRSNLPQIRADLSDPGTLRLARTFAAPVVVHANLRDGSLRQAAREAGVTVLLYEAGEALRFHEIAIRTGVRGVLRVMAALGMLRRPPAPIAQPPRALSSYWVRAPIGGILQSQLRLGSSIVDEAPLGLVTDPFGEVEEPIRARRGGLLIGMSKLPIVNRGDALFHIAQLARGGDYSITVAELEQQLEADPVLDEDYR